MAHKSVVLVSGESGSTRFGPADAAMLAVGSGFVILTWMFARGHTIGAYGVETDLFAVYIPNAEIILNREPYTWVEKPAGYMLILGWVRLLVGDYFLAGKLISLIAGTGMLALAYLIARSLFSPQVALGTAVVFVPVLLPHTMVAATDTLAGMAALLPLWLFTRARRHSLGTMLGIGILTGLAYSIRTTTAWVPAGIFLTLLLVPQPTLALSARLRLCLLLTLGFGLGAGPWFWVVWRVTGTPLGSQQYRFLAVRFLGSQKIWNYGEIIAMGSRYDSLFDLLGQHGIELALGLIAALPGNLNLVIMGALWFPGNLLVGGGIANIMHGLWPQEQASRRWAVICIAISLCASIVYLSLITYQPRYYIAPMALVIMVGLVFCFDNQVLPHIRRHWLHVALPWLLIMLIVVMQANQSRGAVHEVLASEPHNLVKAGAWLKDYAEPHDLLLARKPHLGYFSGLGGTNVVMPGVDTADELVPWARQIGVRFVLYTDTEAGMWPVVQNLADPDQAPDGLTLVYALPEDNTLIYEVTP